jgi:hypothetical protein
MLKSAASGTWTSLRQAESDNGTAAAVVAEGGGAGLRK